jgi:hypothetical protein
MPKHKAARPSRRLIPALSALGLAAGSLILVASPATADHGSSPSDDAAACAAAGGDFTDLGDGLTQCVVTTTQADLAPASHKNKPWTAEITTTTTTTYTTLVEVTPPVTATRCLNQTGGIVGAWNPASPNTGNPNCVEAYQNGGQQAGPSGFQIAEVVIEEGSTVVTHEESSTSESAQTGCFNHNGNAIVDWPGNPNCVPA